MCTGIRLNAHNGAVVFARTLEFAQDIESSIILIPRNFTFQGTTPSGEPRGLRWQSKYAVVGANAASQIGVIDGVNEKGLAGGLFYFTDYAQYQEVPKEQAQNSIASWELLTLILTSCSRVDEVKKLVSSIYVSSAVFQGWGITPPLHAIVHDAQGNSVVIEYVQGKLMLYDNPLGVFTNAPPFDWHITNLNNYVNLGVFNVNEKQLNVFNLKATSQGSGMLGLPGDFSSASRFVRAVAYSQSVIDIKNEEDARNNAFHILNLFDIPRGSVRQMENGQVAYDYTQWTSASDLRNKKYYYRTYEDQQIRGVDLMQLQIDGSQVIIMPMK